MGSRWNQFRSDTSQGIPLNGSRRGEGTLRKSNCSAAGSVDFFSLSRRLLPIHPRGILESKKKKKKSQRRGIFQLLKHPNNKSLQDPLRRNRYKTFHCLSRPLCSFISDLYNYEGFKEVVPT